LIESTMDEEDMLSATKQADNKNDRYLSIHWDFYDLHYKNLRIYIEKGQ